MTKIILIALSLMSIYLNYKEKKDKKVGFFLFLTIFWSLSFFTNTFLFVSFLPVDYIAFHIWLTAFWIILLFGCILAVENFRKKYYVETTFSVIIIVSASILILNI